MVWRRARIEHSTDGTASPGTPFTQASRAPSSYAHLIRQSISRARSARSLSRLESATVNAAVATAAACAPSPPREPSFLVQWLTLILSGILITKTGRIKEIERKE